MANTDDDDLFTLVMLGMSSLGVICAAGLALATTAWTKSLAWLLEHQVVVPAAGDPLIRLPHSDGAGLDLSRCFVAAAVLLVVAFTLIQGLRRRWARDRELS